MTYILSVNKCSRNSNIKSSIMKTLSFKDLNLGPNDLLQRDELRSILGGARGCCNRIRYDDGYEYSACNGSSVEECRGLVGQSFQVGDQSMTVYECFCSDGHGPNGFQDAPQFTP